MKRITARHRVRRRALRASASGLLTLAVAGGLLAVGIRGGYSASRPRLLSGSAWLVSGQLGQLTLLDGSSAEVAAQVQVAPRGNRLDVVQQGATAYAVDRTAGAIRRVDGATFQAGEPATPLPDAGDGLRAFAGPDALYAMDTHRGILADADPLTLAGRSTPVSLAADVRPDAATVDGDGRLWVLDTATGDLVWVSGGQRHVRRGAVGAGTGVLAVADGVPVLVDTARRTAATLDTGTGEASRTVGLDLRPDDRIQVSGSPHAARLYVVANRGVLNICDLTATNCATAVPLGAQASDLGAAVETGGRVFIPDYTTGRVWIVDLRDSRVVAQPQVLAAGTRFQLLTRDGIVFFNDPDGERAGVIHLDGGVKVVAKYDPRGPGKGGIAGAVRAAAPAKPDRAPDRKAPEPPKKAAEPGPVNPPASGDPPADPARPGLPQVHITVSTDTPAIDVELMLMATGDAGKPQPVAATWSFGDGTAPAAGLGVAHSWSAAGMYQVSVQATFADKRTATASVPIKVVKRPTLTMRPSIGGSIDAAGVSNVICFRSLPPVCSATLDPGQVVNLTATPGAGALFRGWGGDCAGTTGTTCTVTMRGDATVTASFAPPATLTVTPAPANGSVTGPGGLDCPGTCSATFHVGDRIVLTAVPSGGFGVLRWGGSCGGSGDTCPVTLDRVTDVSVTFDVRHTLTVEDPGPAGSVRGPGISCPPTCSATYNPGQRITLTAVPDGDDFLGWGDDCVGFLMNPNCTLTMNANHHASASFGFIERCPPICPGGIVARGPGSGARAARPSTPSTGGPLAVVRERRRRRAPSLR